MKKLVFRERNSEDTVYDLEVDGEKVGYISIVHKPFERFTSPRQCSSHVYYEINENQRGKGYGNQILRLGLIQIKESGVKNIILTCYEDNIPSRKVIEFNGGISDGLWEDSGGDPILKYHLEI